MTITSEKKQKQAQQIIDFTSNEIIIENYAKSTPTHPQIDPKSPLGAQNWPQITLWGLPGASLGPLGGLRGEKVDFESILEVKMAPQGLQNGLKIY